MFSLKKSNIRLLARDCFNHQMPLWINVQLPLIIQYRNNMYYKTYDKIHNYMYSQKPTDDIHFILQEKLKTLYE